MGFGRVLIVAAAAAFVAASAQAGQLAVLATAEPGSVPLVPGQQGVAEPPAETLAATPPVAAQVDPSAGHQASDAVLTAALAAEPPNALQKVDPLERPEPTLFADIDLTNQRMTVSDDSGVLGSWKISSARGGYVTPTGTYTVQWTSRMHYSRQYDWSPMPYSVFFHRGYAVHGTNATGRLGRPASHGCVRAHPRDAKTFYNLVHQHGPKMTRIVVRGTPPYTPAVAERRRPRYRDQPVFKPFGFFAYEPPSYNARKRRYRRQQYGGGYYGAW